MPNASAAGVNKAVENVKQTIADALIDGSYPSGRKSTMLRSGWTALTRSRLGANIILSASWRGKAAAKVPWVCLLYQYLGGVSAREPVQVMSIWWRCPIRTTTWTSGIYGCPLARRAKPCASTPGKP